MFRFLKKYKILIAVFLLIAVSSLTPTPVYAGGGGSGGILGAIVAIVVTIVLIVAQQYYALPTLGTLFEIAAFGLTGSLAGLDAAFLIGETISIGMGINTLVGASTCLA